MNYVGVKKNKLNYNMRKENTVIEVKDGNIGKALKEYKSKTLAYGIKERLTKKKYFIKPSELKRLQKQKAVFNATIQRKRNIN